MVKNKGIKNYNGNLGVFIFGLRLLNKCKNSWGKIRIKFDFG